MTKRKIKNLIRKMMDEQSNSKRGAHRYHVLQELLGRIDNEIW